jgi:light-regulated signal transduction histidine kinase (bacteriophytochrome)
MVRLFTNLISNAIKYRSKEAPRISIRAERTGIHWQFAVSDNGIGIDPQDHATVFEMFKRLHGKEYQGSGVGLALCKRLVEKNGGKIWVESQAGAGSTFYFTLPAVKSQRTGPGSEATARARA